MEKRYTIPAELFTQIKDLLSILTLPHIMDHIKNVDRLTANDILSVHLSIDQIATRRIITDMMRTAWQSGDKNAVIDLRKLRDDMNKAPEGVDAYGE